MRTVLGGTIKTFNTKPAPVQVTTTPPFYILNGGDPEPPSSKYSSLESCQSPNLKGTHFLQRGSRGEGSKVNCSSLGWNKLWWVVDLMCQQWRSNRPWWSSGLFITLTAGITINLSSAEGIHLVSSATHSKQSICCFFLVLFLFV